MRIFLICIFALTFVSGTSISSAQEDSSVNTEILTLALGAIPKTYYYKNNGKTHALVVSNRGISTAIKYSGAASLAIYISKDALQNAGADTKPDFVATITKNYDRHLLVFIEPNERAAGDAKEVAALNVYGISSKTLKAGDYRVINMFTEPVRVDIHESSVTVEPSETQDIAASQWEEKAKMVSVKMGLKQDDEVKNVISSLWGYRAEQRSFLFVLDSGNKRRPLRVKKFYDMPKIKARQPDQP